MSKNKVVKTVYHLFALSCKVNHLPYLHFVNLVFEFGLLLTD